MAVRLWDGEAVILLGKVDDKRRVMGKRRRVNRGDGVRGEG